jgi:hypothetical protein
MVPNIAITYQSEPIRTELRMVMGANRSHRDAERKPTGSTVVSTSQLSDGLSNLHAGIQGGAGHERDNGRGNIGPSAP